MIYGGACTQLMPLMKNCIFKLRDKSFLHNSRRSPILLLLRCIHCQHTNSNPVYCFFCTFETNEFGVFPCRIKEKNIASYKHLKLCCYIFIKKKEDPSPPTVWLSVVVCAKSWINIKHFAYKAIKFHLWVFGCFFLCLFFCMVALKTIFRAGTDFFILSN